MLGTFGGVLWIEKSSKKGHLNKCVMNNGGFSQLKKVTLPAAVQNIEQYVLPWSQKPGFRSKAKNLRNSLGHQFLLAWQNKTTEQSQGPQIWQIFPLALPLNSDDEQITLKETRSRLCNNSEISGILQKKAICIYRYIFIYAYHYTYSIDISIIYLYIYKYFYIIDVISILSITTSCEKHISSSSPPRLPNKSIRHPELLAAQKDWMFGAGLWAGAEPWSQEKWALKPL